MYGTRVAPIPTKAACAALASASPAVRRYVRRRSPKHLICQWHRPRASEIGRPMTYRHAVGAHSGFYSIYPVLYVEMGTVFPSREFNFAGAQFASTCPPPTGPRSSGEEEPASEKPDGTRSQVDPGVAASASTLRARGPVQRIASATRQYFSTQHVSANGRAWPLIQTRNFASTQPSYTSPFTAPGPPNPGSSVRPILSRWPGVWIP